MAIKYWPLNISGRCGGDGGGSSEGSKYWTLSYCPHFGCLKLIMQTGAKTRV